jgi:multiple sugar transport system substrate-binding protein
LVATANAYEADHDVTIDWEQRSLLAFGVQPLKELVQDYDLIVLDHPHIGDAAHNGYLVPIDEFAPKDILDRLARESLGRSHESYEYNGHQWALAVDAAAQVSAYRPDLLERTPSTWLEVVKLAEAGGVLWPLKAADAISSFYTLAANRGTPCAQSPDEFISVPDGLAVLSALEAVRRNLPSECLEMDPIGALEQLSSADRYGYCPLLFGYSNYARDGFRAKLVRFTNIPALGTAGPIGALLGGAGLGVSSRCENPETAVDYTLWVASAEVQRTIYVTEGGQPGNSVAWSDPRANAITHNYFSDIRQTLDLSWTRPRYPGYPEFQDRFMELLHGHLVAGGKPDALITRLNDEYRRSRELTAAGESKR